MRKELIKFLERLAGNKGHCEYDWYISAGVLCGNALSNEVRNNRLCYPNLCPVFKRITCKYCLKDEACKIARSLLWEETVEEVLSDETIKRP